MPQPNDDLQHACVVRCFAMEEDQDFVYLALERCKQTLAQMMTASPSQEDHFVDEAGYPTAWCMQVRLPLSPNLFQP